MPMQSNLPSQFSTTARLARGVPLAVAVFLALTIITLALAGVVGILLAAPPSAQAATPPAAQLAIQPAAQDGAPIAGGQPYPAPDFTAPTVEQRVLSLSQWRGRYVLLNFWATWCVPCVEEMPSLQRLQQQLGPEQLGKQQLVVVGVAQDADGARLVRPFLRENSIRFPIVLDPGQTISRRYGVNVLPVTFLINPRGQVIAIARGGRDWAAPNTLRYLADLIRERPEG